MGNTTSCVSKAPFIKLEDTGQAAILNYNLPQETTYNAVSHVAFDVSRELFKTTEVSQTTSPTWTSIEQLREQSAETIIETMQEKKLIQGTHILNKCINLQTTQLAKVTNLTLLDKLKSTTALSKSLQISSFQHIPDGLLTPIANMPQTLPLYTAVDVRNAVCADMIDDHFVARKIAKNYLPVVKQRFSKKTDIIYVPKPLKATPTISLVLHMKMASYLGNYGAGQTVKTFSLLPGEKTTITVRSYQHDEAVKTHAQNILDSYSESSADDLQNSIETTSQYTSGYSKEEAESKTGGWDAGGSFGLDLGVFSIGGGGGYNENKTSGSSLNESMQTQVGNLVGSVSHHVAKADSSRQIQVNSETSNTRISEQEETIVRELENINHSRTLNFVFRQLLQEFYSVTYLYDVSVVYYNGFPESKRTAKLSQLDGLLNAVMKDAASVASVKDTIFSYLCNIFDYQGTPTSFIEKMTENLGNCITPEAPAKTVTYVRKRKGLQQTYKDKKVDGIILDVTHRIVRTPSLVTEALLGQGEALDCYNQQLQDQAVMGAVKGNALLDLDIQKGNQTINQIYTDLDIANQKGYAEINLLNQQANYESQSLQTEIDRKNLAYQIISNIGDPQQQATLYKKVYGDCCNVPQSGCSCANCSDNETV